MPPPGPPLVGDDLALDLVNTRAMTSDGPVDWIATGPDLLAWATRAGLLRPHEAVGLRRSCPRAELDRAARETRELRESFREFLAGSSAARGRGVLLQRLNVLLARRPVVAALDGTPDGFAWRDAPPSSDVDALLAALAQAVGERLVRGLERVRRCQGEGCVLWFHDGSKRGDRRWCSMSVCGNRAKVAAHRARGRAAAGNSPDDRG